MKELLCMNLNKAPVRQIMRSNLIFGLNKQQDNLNRSPTPRPQDMIMFFLDK
jgi:hypothetical protein